MPRNVYNSLVYTTRLLRTLVILLKVIPLRRRKKSITSLKYSFLLVLKNRRAQARCGRDNTRVVERAIVGGTLLRDFNLVSKTGLVIVLSPST